MPFHAEALKIVNKSFQDKAPEVRIAAARLLQVVTERTLASTAASAGSGAGSGGSQGGGSGNGSGSGGAGASGSGSAAGAGAGGSHASAQGVSLDAILQITAKGMDDVAPEARRAYSVVVGTVLAKYATSSSGRARCSRVRAMGRVQHLLEMRRMPVDDLQVNTTRLHPVVAGSPRRDSNCTFLE